MINGVLTGYQDMKRMRVAPLDIRVGDLVEGRPVVGLRPTSEGVFVARAGVKDRDLLADGLIEIKRPDRVTVQARVQATAVLEIG